MLMDAITTFKEKLSPEERRLVAGLNTPARIQAFLDELIYPEGEKNRSLVDVLRQGKAHCLDGGLFAAAALRLLGYPPLVLDMQPEPGTDDDHVIAIYRSKGCWGSVAKSNYSGLRLREPVYRTLRELVMSYFEDSFNMARQKTLRTYTRPVNLVRFDRQEWMTEASGVDAVEAYLKTARLIPILKPGQAEALSSVDERSFNAGTLGLNPDGVYKLGDKNR
jgi:hypothetical protein